MTSNIQINPTTNLPNDWDLTSIIALSYNKELSYNGQKRAVERYASYTEFATHAMDTKLGIFFDSNKNEINDFFEKSNKQIEIAALNNAKIITIWDKCYPDLLRNIDNPPTILFLKGELQSPDAFSISVVGTRKCSTYGKLATELFVSEFVKHNIVITSGMAYGIDSVAHKTAMKNGGITYAVIASGLDKINPQVSNEFANQIIDAGGAIISEYKMGTSALQGYFLQRNRIISGISKATLVVESAYKGGSLNTAKNAFDQQREVFAIPGTVFAEKSLGTNNLIATSKAAIATSPTAMLKDVCPAEINIDMSPAAEKSFNSKEEELIYSKLSSEPTHIDEIPHLTNLEISEVLVQLLEMEFNGLVKQLPGKYYIRE